MATKVLVPLLGEGVEEVTVTKWLKQEGDYYQGVGASARSRPDKVDTEIPAPASGTVLKIVAQEGVPAKVGTILAFIGKPGESMDVSTMSKLQSTSAISTQPVLVDFSTNYREQRNWIYLSCCCQDCCRTWSQFVTSSRHRI